MIKISVIVPVYNVAKYLPACMDSIVLQTLQEIEIICVNDGSTDNCGEILERYSRKDKRILVITQSNQGLSHARNTGIALAKGEYVGLVDSDDVICPDYYEKLYAAAQKQDADIAATNIRRFLFGRYKLRYCEAAIYTDVQAKMDAANIPRYNYVWNKIYRKSLILQYPFTEGIYFEDINWTIKIVYGANKLVTVPDTAYYYRKISQSIVQSRSERKTEDWRLAMKELLDFAKAHRIRFKERDYMKQKTRVMLFGITVFKGYHWSYRSRYKLFGILPFLTVERS
jgi:glycosyltransferase involved in cell wall biosynthesis